MTQIISDRRALHQIPELGMDLPNTMDYLKASLAGLPCRVFSPIPEALCAWFDFGADTALAFRADMDALPMTEVSDCGYRSRHPGKMHACGHDGHMAILLELARRLSKKQKNPRNILLVFQPAEETVGGAKHICQTGIFQEYHVEAIFGIHLWPGLHKGVIASRANEMMARASEINVDIFGRSAHIARAWEGVDALAAGAEFYQRAMAMEAAIPAHIFRLLKFGKFESGTVRNALSAHTHMEGSLRAFQDDVFEEMCRNLCKIGAETEEKWGCRVQIDINSGYPAVLNPPKLAESVRQVLPFQLLDSPAMTAEDFSFYQQVLPGMFFFLGAGDSPALHTSNFDFDETILEKGADFFEKLAVAL